ncbi:hypothetical protein [Geoalkalibacter subterraneus]|uniref:Uncharacterized protein n=1 Tax=Geoalkalibacter subterraneus TaxID=483547 RepID=A0A0B5FLB1_9BACT|nr:hypothetical protein [Geoalkalibacter subterraneus]AJF08188.1 hypothetical protein GSUB_16990 [Geoalkalibacter subterraneus]
MKTDKQYATRNTGEQGVYFDRHNDAMTREALHGKHRIAAELAHRDIIIERLRAELAAERMTEEKRELKEARDLIKWVTHCASIKGPAGTTAYIVSDSHMQKMRKFVEKE